jgi:hypothetical protein
LDEESLRQVEVPAFDESGLTRTEAAANECKSSKGRQPAPLLDNQAQDRPREDLKLSQIVSKLKGIIVSLEDFSEPFGDIRFIHIGQSEQLG